MGQCACLGGARQKQTASHFIDRLRKGRTPWRRCGDGSRYRDWDKIKKKESEFLVSSSGKVRAQVPSPGWRVGFMRLLEFLMGSSVTPVPRLAHRCLGVCHQWLDEAGTLLSIEILGLLVGVATLVSVKKKINKYKPPRVSSKIVCGGGVGQIYGSQLRFWNRVRGDGCSLHLSNPFYCYGLCRLIAFHSQNFCL